MGSYFAELRHATMNRRGLLKAAAGSAGAAAIGSATGSASAAVRPFVVPGVALLTQDASSVTFGLDADVRGLEPALAYDFTANPVVCNISEPLMRFTPEGSLETYLADSFEQTDEVTYVYTLRDGIVFSDGSPVTI